MTDDEAVRRGTFRDGRMFEGARAIVLASLPKNISEPERKRMLYKRFYREQLPIAAATLAKEA